MKAAFPEGNTGRRNLMLFKFFLYYFCPKVHFFGFAVYTHYSKSFTALLLYKIRNKSLQRFFGITNYRGNSGNFMSQTYNFKRLVRTQVRSKRSLRHAMQLGSGGHNNSIDIFFVYLCFDCQILIVVGCIYGWPDFSNLIN